jgi:nitrite reductase (NO-forming)
MTRLFRTTAVSVFLLLGPFASYAKTVKVTLTAKEVDLPIDNKGTTYKT